MIGFLPRQRLRSARRLPFCRNITAEGGSCQEYRGIMFLLAIPVALIHLNDGSLIPDGWLNTTRIFKEGSPIHKDPAKGIHCRRGSIPAPDEPSQKGIRRGRRSIPVLSILHIRVYVIVGDDSPCPQKSWQRVYIAGRRVTAIEGIHRARVYTAGAEVSAFKRFFV